MHSFGDYKEGTLRRIIIYSIYFSNITMSLKKLLPALALSFGLPALAAFPAPSQDTPWVVKSNTEMKRNNFTLSVNVNFLELQPQTMQIDNADSILNEADLETVTMLTLGLSLDYNLLKHNLGSHLYMEVPVGADVHFSSSKLFGEVIDDSGKISRQGIKADYSIEGSINYLAVGMRLLPKLYYQKGDFKMGANLVVAGGVNYLHSKNKFSATISNKETRELLESVNINPDIEGDVDISGIGGFVQVATGPVIGYKNFVCTYNVGYRYDMFNFFVVESSNSAAIGMDDKEYWAEYGQSSLIHTAGCGYEF